MDTSSSFRTELRERFPLSCDEEVRAQPKACQDDSGWTNQTTGQIDADELGDRGGRGLQPAAHLQLIPDENVTSNYEHSTVVQSELLAPQPPDVDLSGGPDSSNQHDLQHRQDPMGTPELGANPGTTLTQSLYPPIDGQGSGPRSGFIQAQCTINFEDDSHEPSILNVHFSESGVYDGNVNYEELGIQPKDEAVGKYQILASASVRTHAQEIREVCYGSAEALSTAAEMFEETSKSEVPHGVILHQMRRQLTIINGCYDKTDYEELGLLGRGRQGQCVKARDLRSGFHFCIKKVDDAEYRPEEIKLMLKLTDVRGIVRIFGALKQGHTVHILMELLDGMSLADWIRGRRAGRKVDQDEITLLLDIFKRILGLLLQLEHRGILHEDIKALNIMVIEVDNDPLVPYLIDFGAARYAPALKYAELRGTTTHFSPEKARSEGHSYGAEVYAAMATFVNMLLGSVPFDDLSNDMKVIWQVGDKGPPFSKLPKWIPSNILRLIERGWTEDPDQRGTASELLEEVSQVVRDGVDELNGYPSDSSSLHEDCESEETSSSTVASPTTLGIRYKTQDSELDEYDEDGQSCLTAETGDGYEGDEDYDSDDEDDDEDHEDHPLADATSMNAPQIPRRLSLDQSGDGSMESGTHSMDMMEEESLVHSGDRSMESGAHSMESMESWSQSMEQEDGQDYDGDDETDNDDCHHGNSDVE